MTVACEALCKLELTSGPRMSAAVNVFASLKQPILT